MNIDRALCELIERAEDENVAREYRVGQRIVPNVRQACVPIAGGAARYFAPDLKMNKAMCLGMDCNVSGDDIEMLTSFYREREAPARVVVSDLSDPTFVGRLENRGYRAVQAQHALAGELGTMQGALDPRVRVATDLEAWGSAAEEIQNSSDPTIARVTGELLGSGEGVVPFELVVDDRLAAVCAMGMVGDTGTLFFGHTLPWARNRGLQTALIRHRVRLLQEAGARYVRATIVPDTSSERNAQRAGMQIVYNRTVWELPLEG